MYKTPDRLDVLQHFRIATAVRAVNAVPTLCDAAPGVKTFLDLPMFGGFAGLDRMTVAPDIVEGTN